MGGIIAIIGPDQIGDVLLRSYGIVVMVLVATLAWFFMVARKRVGNIQAVILLVIYVIAMLMLSDLGIGIWMRQMIDVLLNR